MAILVILLTITVAFNVADIHAAAEIYAGLGQRTPTVHEVQAAVGKAREINLLKRGITLLGRNNTGRRVLRCPLSLHHGTRQLSDAKISIRANDALLAVRTVMIDGGYSLQDLQRESVQNVFKRVTGLSCDVPRPSKCDFNSSYRNADGSCNNRQNPDWGMAGSVQRRVLSNDYDDSLGSPRTKGFKGRSLPNSRSVSNSVHFGALNLPDIRSNRLTLHVMGFGQFVDHDIARTPETEDENCCHSKSREDIDKCFNIIIPLFGFDPSPIFVPGYCMEVKRSAPVFCPDATSKGVSLRQQTNSLTSFVDASNVYGSSGSRQAELRENGNGFRMKASIFGNQQRLLNGPDTCTLTNSSQSCSAAGDGRVNEVPTLTSYHFLFVKEHNRIADTLEKFYDNDETIFQETRRILIAVLQKIVYDEYLPSFFSQEGLQKYQLQSSAKYVYNPDIDPTMLNAFGIAYRVGHTWVPQLMRLFSRSLNQINNPDFNRRTEETLMNPNLTYFPNGFERLAYYLSGSQSPETDSIIEEAVRSRLFLDTDNNIAFDLAALNIQRGRDHGLPSYNEYREWCSLSSARKNWDFFGNSGLTDHTYRARNTLRNAGYKSPLDIDLFAGGLTETPISGGNLGPTFECIIGQQFQRLKFGDRLWYQNKDAGFTVDQIAAIQKYSLSKVLCNNYNFERIHFPSAFESRSSGEESGENQGNWWNSGHGGNSGANDWFFDWLQNPGTDSGSSEKESGENQGSWWNSGHGGNPGSNDWFSDWTQNPETNSGGTLTSCDDIPDLDLSAFDPRVSKKTMTTY